MFSWYFYAIGSVIFKVLFDITRKNTLKKTHAMNLESIRSLLVFIFSLVLLPFINLRYDAKSIALVYLASLLSTAGILYVSKAYKHTDISLLEPLDNFRPAFVAILAFIFLSESITPIQIVGIAVLVISAYLLESDHHFSNLVAPLKSIFKSKYNLLFLLGTLLFAISSILEKFIIDYKIRDIYALFFLIWFFIAINFNIIHIYLYGFKETVSCFKKTKYSIILVALFSIFANLLAYKATSLTYVSLVIPVFTLTNLLVVIFGGKFFHERFLYFRIFVSALMLVGAYLIIM